MCLRISKLAIELAWRRSVCQIVPAYSQHKDSYGHSPAGRSGAIVIDVPIEEACLVVNHLILRSWSRTASISSSCACLLSRPSLNGLGRSAATSTVKLGRSGDLGRSSDWVCSGSDDVLEDSLASWRGVLGRRAALTHCGADGNVGDVGGFANASVRSCGGTPKKRESFAARIRRARKSSGGTGLAAACRSSSAASGGPGCLGTRSEKGAAEVTESGLAGSGGIGSEVRGACEG